MDGGMENEHKTYLAGVSGEATSSLPTTDGNEGAVDGGGGGVLAKGVSFRGPQSQDAEGTAHIP